MAKVTVTLPDELRRRAKERAAREGTTLSAVVRERLEEFAEELDLAEEAEDVRVSDEIAGRVRRGEEALHEWGDVKARLDALPG